MRERNPYSPPASSAPPPSPALTGVRRACVLLLVALQFGLSLLYSRRAITLVRHGEISISGFTLASTSLLLLGMASLLLLGKSRFTAHLFGASALLGALALFQWQFPLVATCTGIAALASIVCHGLVRSPAKA